MNHKLYVLVVIALFVSSSLTYGQTKITQQQPETGELIKTGFVNAAHSGFSPEASGIENAKALQRAVDQTGTITVSKPGTYKMAGTVYIGSNTSLVFGNNVVLKKVDEKGTFSHVLINKGARTKTYDQNITIEGLYIIVNGRIYRVQAKADGTVYKSMTRPMHESGSQVLDGINWGVVQTDVTYTAGVRNVVFRDIFLEKPRIGFSVHFDNDRYSRSYYPGAEIPKQEQLVFDNIRVIHNQPTEFLSIGTPVDVLTITNSSFKNNRINFHGNKAMPDYLKTKINIYGCVFNQKGTMELITNSVENKEIFLKTSSNADFCIGNLCTGD